MAHHSTMPCILGYRILQGGRETFGIERQETHAQRKISVLPEPVVVIVNHIRERLHLLAIIVEHLLGILKHLYIPKIRVTSFWNAVLRRDALRCRKQEQQHCNQQFCFHSTYFYNFLLLRSNVQKDFCSANLFTITIQKTCTSTFVPLNLRPALRNEYIARGFPALYVCYFWNRFGVLKKYKAHNSKYV